MFFLRGVYPCVRNKPEHKKEPPRAEKAEENTMKNTMNTKEINTRAMNEQEMDQISGGVRCKPYTPPIWYSAQDLLNTTVPCIVILQMPETQVITQTTII